MVILNRWAALRMTDEMEVTNFMQEVYGLLNELDAIGQPQANTIVAHKILNALPQPF